MVSDLDHSMRNALLGRVMYTNDVLPIYRPANDNTRDDSIMLARAIQKAIREAEAAFIRRNEIAHAYVKTYNRARLREYGLLTLSAAFGMAAAGFTAGLAIAETISLKTAFLTASIISISAAKGILQHTLTSSSSKVATSQFMMAVRQGLTLRDAWVRNTNANKALPPATALAYTTAISATVGLGMVYGVNGIVSSAGLVLIETAKLCAYRLYSVYNPPRTEERPRSVGLPRGFRR